MFRKLHDELLVGQWGLDPLRACFKIPWGPVFAEKAGWRGATTEHIRQRSATEEQQSQRAFSAKTLRAAGLLSAACVDSAVTARCGDAPASPPWPQPKSLAAGPQAILKQALRPFLSNIFAGPAESGSQPRNTRNTRKKLPGGETRIARMTTNQKAHFYPFVHSFRVFRVFRGLKFPSCPCCIFRGLFHPSPVYSAPLEHFFQTFLRDPQNQGLNRGIRGIRGKSRPEARPRLHE